MQGTIQQSSVKSKEDSTLVSLLVNNPEYSASLPIGLPSQHPVPLVRLLPLRLYCAKVPRSEGPPSEPNGYPLPVLGDVRLYCTVWTKVFRIRLMKAVQKVVYEDGRQATQVSAARHALGLAGRGIFRREFCAARGTRAHDVYATVPHTYD